MSETITDRGLVPQGSQIAYGQWNGQVTDDVA